jgi:hypothetical protein
LPGNRIPLRNQKGDGALTYLTTLLLLAVVLGAPAVGGAQTFTLYDSFNTSTINPARWSGSEQNTNPAAIVNLEAIRRIVQPDPTVANLFLQLVLTTAHTGTGSDVGRAGDGRNSLRINRADLRDNNPAITGIQIRGLVVSAAAQDCPTNAMEATRAEAQIIGVFFNDGTSTGPGDRTGDVLAGINVSLNSNATPPGHLLVAFINKCTDPVCTFSSTLNSAIFTHTWTLGTPGRLTIRWDHILHKFVYTLGNPLSPLETHELAYIEPDLTPPVNFVHDLRVVNRLPNCSTPIKASTTARVDFVSIITEAVFP